MRPKWMPFENGTTKGTPGSEQGTIVLDDEYQESARITIERGGTAAPWSFTCGIYGLFVHTAFADSEEAITSLAIKAMQDMEAILEIQDADVRYDRILEFVSTY